MAARRLFAARRWGNEPETFLVSLRRLVRHLQSGDEAGFYRWSGILSAPMASRDGASFGCQQRRVASRQLEKLSRLTAIAYRTRLRNRLAVDKKSKQHAIFRQAHSARFHVFAPRPVHAMQSRNDWLIPALEYDLRRWLLGSSRHIQLAKSPVCQREVDDLACATVKNCRRFVRTVDPL